MGPLPESPPQGFFLPVIAREILCPNPSKTLMVLVIGVLRGKNRGCSALFDATAAALMSSTDPKTLLPPSLAARVSALTIKNGRAIAVVDAAGLGTKDRADIERAISDTLGQRED